MNIQDNCIVSIHYTLTNQNGDMLDQSTDSPLVYLHGGAGIVPALETELAGKTAGDTFDVTVSPDGGFGEHRAELLQQVPRQVVPDDIEVALGVQVELSDPQGLEQTGAITAFDDDSVTVDFNHPLAGMTLHFKGEVDDVRMASEAEIEQWPNPVESDDKLDS
jgi:FKBP-type peptidyl-prolyl cis-trans isomerase SlyD